MYQLILPFILAAMTCEAGAVGFTQEVTRETVNVVRVPSDMPHVIGIPVIARQPRVEVVWLAIDDRASGADLVDLREWEERQLAIQEEQARQDAMPVNAGSGVVYFKTAKHRSGEMVSLSDLLTIARRYPRSYVHVIGHTDDRGSDAYNMGLGQRRADYVADWLISNGIEANRVSRETRGESQPIADNRSKSGRGLNRRSEVSVLITISDLKEKE